MKKMKNERIFKEVVSENGNEFFNFFQVGDSVEGILSEAIEMESKYGKMILFELTSAEGSETIIATAVLMTKLPPLAGKYVKITFTGLKDNKGKNKTYKNYKIEVAEVDDFNDVIPF